MAMLLTNRTVRFSSSLRNGNEKFAKLRVVLITINFSHASLVQPHTWDSTSFKHSFSLSQDKAFCINKICDIRE